MILKNKEILFISILLFFITSCGVYSFTGAAIQGKTINIHFIETMLVPLFLLSPTFTEKLRQRILSQSSLSQVNSEKTDHDISGSITNYDVTVASVTGAETSSKNRLTITVSIEYKNKLNEKSNFVTNFCTFLDILIQTKIYKMLRPD